MESDNFNAKYQEFVQLDYKEIEDFCRSNYKSDTEFASLELLDKLVCEMKNPKMNNYYLLNTLNSVGHLLYIYWSLFLKKYLKKELYQIVLNLE